MNVFVRYGGWLAYKMCYKFNIEGIENIPQDRAVIIASNHRSLADPAMLTMPMKLPVTYMAKEELFEKKLFSKLITALGAFPVKRGAGDMQVIENAVNILKSGKHLVIFAEGSRSKDGKVGRGKSGVALIAAKSGADVLPAGIIFEGEKLRFRVKLTVRFGKIIPAEELALSEEKQAGDLKRIKKRIMDEIRLLVEGEPNED
ncbi:MAG: 1-acyl-sn-glycerol-3-phosphate acyltransferase [Oscillospiraceae bacterium]|nr:1-acyl-sn-glycerol-3-phosphate acyltransferase [Oscillospiraceae bacterium]